MNALVYRSVTAKGQTLYSLKAPKKGKYVARQLPINEKELVSKALRHEWGVATIKKTMHEGSEIEH